MYISSLSVFLYSSNTLNELYNPSKLAAYPTPYNEADLQFLIASSIKSFFISLSDIVIPPIRYSTILASRCLSLFLSLPIVVDIGSGEIKAGFSGEEKPK